jgi:class 3 adenylate cyclase
MALACMGRFAARNTRAKKPEQRLDMAFAIAYGEVFIVPGEICGKAVSLALRLSEHLTPGAVLIDDPSFFFLDQKCISNFRSRPASQQPGKPAITGHHIHGQVIDKKWIDIGNQIETAFPESALTLRSIALSRTKDPPNKAALEEKLQSNFGIHGFVLHTDVGGQNRIRRNGLIQMLSLIARQQVIVVQTLQDQGVRIVDIAGTRIRAVIPRVATAICAGLMLFAHMERYNADKSDMDRLACKIAITCGDLLVDSLEDISFVYGKAVDEAESLSMIARDGEIVLSPEVKEEMRLSMAAYYSMNFRLRIAEMSKNEKKDCYIIEHHGDFDRQVQLVSVFWFFFFFFVCLFCFFVRFSCLPNQSYIDDQLIFWRGVCFWFVFCFLFVYILFARFTTDISR